jgi:CO/xanthine dehydrogenase FAD-binding subunit
LISDAPVSENARVLVKAISTIGSLQIRNVGTIGGNAANASPAADSVPALMVHDAWVRIKSARAERVEPLADFIVAPNKTTLKSDEIITAFVLKRISGDYRSSFHRIARRRSLSIARINCAALAKCADDGKVVDLRLSLGSITPSPRRMTQAEEFVKGRYPTLDVIADAAELVSAEMVRVSGIRSSTEYKKPAAEGLTIKCLMEVFGLNDKAS